ncbi:magnesium transporter CorA family protein [Entomospira nematocerorum]|uniref:Magnesium transporter CorA family protein n=1 Tax=Entomospira nematocerorum TaxID=2719987 RepID=A0A968KXW4_9SPIO|nr:magnesium transporter CorA family protein [Entomospira nematocera]NIZ46937.1 magnesium transporter CorA family protein [Entomospira nematocera]WDI33266.1 magnesium transporter CorA family protein [Entomospira nematocera]
MIELKKSMIHNGQERSWYQVVAPSHDEIQQLSLQLDISRDDLNDAVDPDELSRFEWLDNGGMMAIVRVPVYDPNQKPAYFTAPLGIIVTDKAMLTLSNYAFSFIDHDIPRKAIISDRSNLLYILSIILRVSYEYSRTLQDLKRAMDDTVYEMRKNMGNDGLFSLLEISKSFVFIMTSLRANAALLEKIQRMRGFSMDVEETDLHNNVSIEMREAEQAVHIHIAILNSTMETFVGVINNNLNHVMRRLTSISLLLMWPSLMASIYGMNVPLPFEDVPHAFWWVALFTVVVEVIIFRFFKKRDLL